MGGAASSHKATDEPSWTKLRNLCPHVGSSGSDTLVVHAVPQFDSALKIKHDTIKVEVGLVGVRLIRPDSEDPIYAFPWGQIHSWTHTNNKFTFKYYDEGTKSVLSFTIFLRDVTHLQEHIKRVIAHILEQRTSEGVSGTAFSSIIDEINIAPTSSRLGMIQTALCENYFTSEQGRRLVHLLDNSFDKVEASIALHGKLIDQNRFNTVLEELDGPEDIGNVWHRISLQSKLHKKPSARLSTSSSFH